MKPDEIIEVETLNVACDGPEGASGHPRVYLSLEKENDHQVVCPYCSKHYKLKEGVSLHAH